MLNSAKYGVLSTITKLGEPYGVPLNFCVIEDCIYFHCATEGRKIDCFKHNKSVSLCVVGNTELLPEKFGTKYSSVIVSGEIKEVFDPEKQIALEELLQKYSSEFFDKGMRYIESLKEQTKVFKITINNLAGKARK